MIHSTRDSYVVVYYVSGQQRMALLSADVQALHQEPDDVGYQILSPRVVLTVHPPVPVVLPLACAIVDFVGRRITPYLAMANSQLLLQ